MGGLFQLFWRRSRHFQELGHCPLFLLWLASELSWCWWVCHSAYAKVLQWVYNEAQGLLEIESSVILDLVGSNQFLSCWNIHFCNISQCLNIPKCLNSNKYPTGPLLNSQLQLLDFIFLGSKITADRDCSHKLKDVCSLEEKPWQTWTAY